MLTLSNWITIGLFVAGGVAAILIGQYHLITRLLADKWEANEKRHSKSEKRMAEAEAEAHEMDLRLNTIETVCKLRHPDNRGGLHGARS
jgi:hypothetical protein